MESRELEDAALLAYEKTMEEWADLTGEGMINDQAWVADQGEVPVSFITPIHKQENYVFFITWNH